MSDNGDNEKPETAIAPAAADIAEPSQVPIQRKICRQLLLAWGANDHGQLANGDTEDAWSPTIARTVKVTHVQSAKQHTAGEISNVADASSKEKQISADIESVADESNNVPVTENPVTPEAAISIITGGGGHTMVLSESGQLSSCGWNAEGQLGLGHRRNEHQLSEIHLGASVKVSAVACGWSHTLAIVGDNQSLYGWGSNAHGQLGDLDGARATPMPVPICKLEDVHGIGCGMRFSTAINGKGQVVGWGSNRYGQLGKEPSKQPILKPVSVWRYPGKAIAVACGSNHTAILGNDNKVWCCGSNEHGQCGDSTPHSTLTNRKPKSSGSAVGKAVQLVTWPAQLVECEEPLREVHCGWSHTVGVSVSGNSIWSWGRAHRGQLGHTKTVHAGAVPNPQKARIGDRVRQLAVGSEHAVCLMENGKTLAWGWNEHGMCGVDDEATTHVPIPSSVSLSDAVEGDADTLRVGCGAGFCMALVAKWDTS